METFVIQIQTTGGIAETGPDDLRGVVKHVGSGRPVPFLIYMDLAGAAARRVAAWQDQRGRRFRGESDLRTPQARVSACLRRLCRDPRPPVIGARACVRSCAARVPAPVLPRKTEIALVDGDAIGECLQHLQLDRRKRVHQTAKLALVEHEDRAG